MSSVGNLYFLSEFCQKLAASVKTFQLPALPTFLTTTLLVW